MLPLMKSIPLTWFPKFNLRSTGIVSKPQTAAGRQPHMIFLKSLGKSVKKIFCSLEHGLQEGINFRTFSDWWKSNPCTAFEDRILVKGHAFQYSTHQTLRMQTILTFPPTFLFPCIHSPPLQFFPLPLLHTFRNSRYQAVVL